MSGGLKHKKERIFGAMLREVEWPQTQEGEDKTNKLPDPPDPPETGSQPAGRSQGTVRTLSG